MCNNNDKHSSCTHSPDQIKGILDTSLAEYNRLRDEILLHLTEANKILYYGILTIGVIATLTGMFVKIESLKSYLGDIIALILVFSPIIYIFFYYSYLRLLRLTITPAKYINLHIKTTLGSILNYDNLLSWDAFLVEIRGPFLKKRGHTWIVGVPGIFQLLCIFLLLGSFFVIYFDSYLNIIISKNMQLNDLQKISIATLFLDFILLIMAFKSTVSTSKQFLNMNPN